MVGLDELVREPTINFIYSWAFQLFDNEQQQLLLQETNPLPLPINFDAETIPTFQKVLDFLQKTNRSTGRTIGAVEFNSDGIERILAWYIHGDDKHRQIKLLLLNEPIQAFINRHSRGSDAEYPGLRLRTDEEVTQNPLNHSPERLAELKLYTGEIPGRILKSFIRIFVTTSMAFAFLFSFYWLLTQGEPTVMLTIYGLYLLASFLVASVLGLQAKLSRVEIAEGNIRFYFAGRLRKDIQLALIDGYELQRGERGLIGIIYGSLRYCPSGLINHKQLAEQLESCSIHRINPE